MQKIFAVLCNLRNFCADFIIARIFAQETLFYSLDTGNYFIVCTCFVFGGIWWPISYNSFKICIYVAVSVEFSCRSSSVPQVKFSHHVTCKFREPLRGKNGRDERKHKHLRNSAVITRTERGIDWTTSW